MNNEIWDVDEALKNLNIVKEKIVDFWGWQKDLGSERRNRWIADAQDLYYQLLNAWDLQQQPSNAPADAADGLHLLLKNAKSRLEQVASELRTVNTPFAEHLELDLREAFDQTWKPMALEAGLKELLAQQPRKYAPPPVLKISGSEYHLPCAICGEIAFTFRIDTPAHRAQKRLVYRGLTHTGDLPARNSSRLFEMLEDHDLAGVHEYLQERGRPEGVDAYCPECDKLYCAGHYHLEELWEQGEYDCTYATCPEEHYRKIDENPEQ